MNILLTSVGRRSYLVEYFKQALGKSGFVFGANSEADTSGMVSSDRAFIVPKVNSQEYIPTLLKICKENQVGLIVSLFDIDLPYLSAEKSQFEAIGVTLVVSNPTVIEVANDKWKTFEFLQSNKIKTPLTFKQLSAFKIGLVHGEIKFPVIVKPRWGMGSIAIYKADTLEEVEFFVSYTQKQIKNSYLNILSNKDLEKSVLIQEFVPGTEYGVDVLNDLEAKHIVTVVKQKMAMRSGETDGAIVVNNERVELLANRVSVILGHIGNLDIDILLDPKSGEHSVLEFNARFGGGYPFSHLAGVNFPKLLIDMVQNKKIDTDLINFTVGIKSLKFIKPRAIV